MVNFISQTVLISERYDNFVLGTLSILLGRGWATAGTPGYRESVQSLQEYSYCFWSK